MDKCNMKNNKDKLSSVLGELSEKNKINYKAIKIVKENETLTLAVIDDKGYPRMYAMEKVRSFDLEEILFITKRTSNKVRFLKANNKCSIEIHNDEDMVSLTGIMDIIEDSELIQKIVPDDYYKRLQRSGLDKYCVLSFCTQYHDLYIDDEFKSW